MSSKHVGVLLVLGSIALALVTVIFFGPRDSADAFNYLASNPSTIVSYVLVAFLYAAFHHGAILELIVLVTSVSGVFLIAKSRKTSTGVSVEEGKPFRIVDALYFFVALPLVLTVVHEYLICTFVPSIGVHGGDTAGCTLGWGFLAVMLFIPPWVILTLTVAPLRMRALYRLSFLKSPIFWLYVIAVLVPLTVVLPIFMRF